MNNAEVFEQEKSYIMQTYKRFPVALERGEGAYVWDYDKKEYLDFLSGIAVNALGYNHPVISKVIRKQASGLIHTSNLFYTLNQTRLAKLLTTYSKMDKAFFCNSGAEANEGAFKLARKWGKGRFEIITALESFHGRTLATLTATGQTKYHAGFEPLVPGFKHVPFNDIEALKNAISKETVAILLEPVQAEGGIRLATPEYLKNVNTICKDNNFLLIFDEIQAGMGRTGKLFSYEHFDVSPDIITIAKSLGCGFPIGAFLARDEIAGSFEFGNHGSTFGGGEFVTGIAIEFLNILYNENLMENVVKQGKFFLEKLTELSKKYANIIEEVRGLGLLLGIQFKEQFKAADIATMFVTEGLLAASAGSNVVRFAPPLIIKEEHVEKAISIIDRSLSKIN
jgi:predicted acetylornithine/succinylornithine family transaminase